MDPFSAQRSFVPPVPRFLRTTVALVLLTVLGWSGTASPSAASERLEWPRIFVERITVEGLRHARKEVILTESLLQPGRAYDEVELRDAVYRIRRLPFIVDADMTLLKGSRRGHYELVIRVAETHPHFFGADFLYSDFSELGLAEEDRPLRQETSLSSVEGWRFYLDKYRVGFVAVEPAGSIQAGLTQFRLFGRPWTLSLGYAFQGCCPLTLQPLAIDPTFSTWAMTGSSETFTATLGVPLGSHRSLRFTALQRQGDGGQRRRIADPGSESSPASAVEFSDLDERRLGVAWVYDTTDDPFFATSGTLLTAAVDSRFIESRLDPGSFAEGTGGVGLGGPGTPFRARLLRVSVLAGRWWPLSERQTLSASLVVAAGRSRVENAPIDVADPAPRSARLEYAAPGLALVSDHLTSWEAVSSVRHSIRLTKTKWSGGGQVFWENTLTTAWEGTSPDFDQLHNPLRQVDFSSVLAIRMTWGVFRIGIRFIDLA